MSLPFAVRARRGRLQSDQKELKSGTGIGSTSCKSWLQSDQKELKFVHE